MPNISNTGSKVLLAIVLPQAVPESEFKVYVVFKLVAFEPDRKYKVSAAMNVLLPNIGQYFDEEDIVSLHQKISLQLKSKPNANLEFLFQNH